MFLNLMGKVSSQDVAMASVVFDRYGTISPAHALCRSRWLYVCYYERLDGTDDGVLTSRVLETKLEEARERDQEIAKVRISKYCIHCVTCIYVCVCGRSVPSLEMSKLLPPGVCVKHWAFALPYPTLPLIMWNWALCVV